MGDSVARLQFPGGHTEEIVIHHHGPALWPEWKPRPELERIRRSMGAVRFAGIYQGQPVPQEGAMMNPAWIRPADPLPKREDLYTIVQAWDLAWGAKQDSDYAVGVTLGIADDQTAYVLDIWRGRGVGNMALMAAWAEEAAKWQPAQIGVEDSPGAQGILIDARNLYNLPLLGLPATTTQKVQRFQFVCARAQGGKLCANKALGWWPTMEGELISFPRGQHDDCVDALSWAFDMVKYVGGQETEDQDIAFVSEDDSALEARRRHFFGRANPE